MDSGGKVSPSRMKVSSAVEGDGFEACSGAAGAALVDGKGDGAGGTGSEAGASVGGIATGMVA